MPLHDVFPFAWMIANPAMSHAVTAVLETTGVALVGIAIRAPRPAATAAVIVSTYYYGRESGQREHDLKRAGIEPVSAHLESAFMVGWSRGNVEQWVAPTVAAWLVALTIMLMMRRRDPRRSPGS